MPRPRALAIALAALVLALSLAVPAVANGGGRGGGDRDVTVMSRNLYLGADIIKAVGSPTPEAQAQAATELFGIVRQTNFPLRSRAIAREIRRTRPHLIGLQEVALWRRTPAGVTNAVKDARVVVYDFLALLQRRLRALGQRYRVEVVQREADFEVPTSEGFDIRLTMRDVILRRVGRGARKLRIQRRLKGNYTTNLTVPIQGQVVTSLRGWTAVDARLGRRALRFVNTHFEAYGAPIRAAQADELARGPLATRSRPVILVGDLNSDPSDTSPEGDAYRRVAAAGFVNAFDPFPVTSGQNETVDNPVSELGKFIDHILSRPRLRTVRSDVVGDRPRDRIGGLWPSDHAGVVATLRLRR